MVERDESRGQEQWNVASLMEVVNLQILSLLTQYNTYMHIQYMY